MWKARLIKAALSLCALVLDAIIAIHTFSVSDVLAHYTRLSGFVFQKYNLNEKM